jgi:hypothetical protein
MNSPEWLVILERSAEKTGGGWKAWARDIVFDFVEEATDGKACFVSYRL